MDMQHDTDIAQVKLPPVLDLAAAESFLETVRGHVAAGTPLTLDASEVETLTLPCMQIIVAAQRTEAPVSIVNASEAFASAFADLGLAWTGESAPVAAPEGAAAQAEPEAAAMQAEPEPASTQIEDAPADVQAAPDLPMEATPMAKRILTIDDSKTIRDMLKFTLLDAGFDVHQAVDGQDGVDILAREQFDVVITDINMPKMDGYEVIRHMRGNSEHKNTPILVLTTESETDKRNLARDAGATGWMVKPFDPAALIATINKVSP
jgi:two-component system chemotaxis response regulator CheY